MCAKPLYIARIDQVNRTPESRVFNSLVMRQHDLIARLGLLNAPLQSGPTRISALAGYGKLRIAQTELGAKDGSIRRFCPPWMKFPEPLGRGRAARTMFLQQVFPLIFEVLEIRIFRKRSYRHTNFLSCARGPHGSG